MTTFAAELHRLLSASGLSQYQLARRTRYDHSYISRLLSGARLPSRETVERLAAALGLDPAEHSRLLAAAGFAPTSVEALLAEVPECGALYEYLRDPAVPDERRQAVRAAVRSLLVVAKGAMAA